MKIGMQLVFHAEHYELLGDHFKTSGAYRAYGDAVDALRAAGVEDVAQAYVGCQTFGTPDEIMARLARRRMIVGDFELNVCLRFAGLPAAEALASMELFGREVLPALRNGAARG